MKDPLQSLSQLHGEGRVTFRALTSAGFRTLGSVARTPLADLAERAHLSARTAQRLQAGAREMIGRGIPADHHVAPSSPRTRRRSGPSAHRSAGVTPQELALLLQDPLRPSKPTSL